MPIVIFTRRIGENVGLIVNVMKNVNFGILINQTDTVISMKMEGQLKAFSIFVLLATSNARYPLVSLQI